jgi:hypothetical protein
MDSNETTTMLGMLNRQDGFALIVGLILLVLVAFIGIAAIRTSDTDVTIAGNQIRRTQAFYFAEAGAEKAAADIFASYRTNGAPPSPLPRDSVQTDIGSISYSTRDLGAASTQVMSQGVYAGLYGLAKRFEVSARGRIDGDAEVVEITQEVQDVLIPVFQFAVFYEHDLEFHPGPDMTIGGRMHTNADMYLGAGSNLYIDSYVTAAGDLYAGRKPGANIAVGTGNVHIKDADGTYQAMEQSGDWLDSRDSNWVTESQTRWDGRVQDGNHGFQQLNLPLAGIGNPETLIDPDNGGANPASFENKAGLKIIDGQAYHNSGGVWVNVTASLQAAGAVTTNTFYDAREAKWIKSVDVDVQALGTTSYFPPNGILYSATTSTLGGQPAVRLVNGAELPKPLTVASVNPVYTQGDYNVTNKKAAAILADAYTILSNNWDDATSDQTLDTRPAGDTRINVAFMTGNTVTGEGTSDYNGGLENLPRLLEDWNGRTLALRGSFVEMWQSRQATGAWGGSYYSPPNRDWAFDTDFLDPNKLPPGTPRVNATQKVSWRQNLMASN